MLSGHNGFDLGDVKSFMQFAELAINSLEEWEDERVCHNTWNGIGTITCSSIFLIPKPKTEGFGSIIAIDIDSGKIRLHPTAIRFGEGYRAAWHGHMFCMTNVACIR